VLSDNDSHHVKNVLRLKVGSLLTAVSRKGQIEFEAIISRISDEVWVKLLSTKASTVFSSKLKSVSVALLKGKRNDQLCDQLTELGAQNIIFWQAERSIAKIEGQKEVAAKLSRWQKIAEGASKQCAQTAIPQLHFAKNIDDLLHLAGKLKSNYDLALVCSLAPQAKSLTQFENPAEGVHLLVGPEGDFTPKEEQKILSSGWSELSLGSLRLRAETAALVASAAVQTLWSNNGEVPPV